MLMISVRVSRINLSLSLSIHLRLELLFIFPSAIFYNSQPFTFLSLAPPYPFRPPLLTVLIYLLVS